MFVVISHQDLGYKFAPGEEEHEIGLGDIIGDLLIVGAKASNHIPQKSNSFTRFNRYQIGDFLSDLGKITLLELNEWIKDIPLRENIKCYNKKGELKKKIGFNKTTVNHPTNVLIGDDITFIEDSDGLWRHFTIRERARIQGFEDDFIFLPLDDSKHVSQVKQTGKCMPIQFAEYFAKQAKEFLEEGILPEKGTRILKPNPHIEKAVWGF